MNIFNVNQFTCECPEGTEGDLCEIVSPCSLDPCDNGATCQDTTDGFTCECVPGYTGALCEIEINECAEDPCLNGGTCIDFINDFECLCPPEYSGANCDVQVIFCEVDSCANGATCIEEVDGFLCMCSSGYTGPTCEGNIDECQLNLCQNNATCMDLEGTFACICAPGFTGETCDSEIDFCASNPCVNGTCTSLTTGFDCECTPGFTGLRCEIEINECESAPCLNGGTCLDDINQAICICQGGFSGPFCDTNVDECTVRSPCQNGGTCRDTFGGFICDCSLAFTGDTCGTQIDFCADGPCFNDGTCNSILGGFECDCPAGWTGNQCQFVESVQTKLSSCGLINAVDIFASNGTSIVFTTTTPPVEDTYTLGSTEGLYISTWIWQTEDTIGSIFSYDNTTTLISDLIRREVVFYYSSLQSGQQSIVFTDVPIRGSEWHHLAFAATSNGSVALAINGVYIRQATAVGFTISDTILLIIGKGDTVSEPFQGLMRGAAIASFADPATFDLAAVESCTLACIGGEGYCTNNGECLDLFGPYRKCSCLYGYTGPFCQYLNNRMSFEGSGFAQLSDSVASLASIYLSFKTDSPSGELYTHAGEDLQSTLRLQNGSLEVELEYCDSTMDSFSLQPSSSVSDLQRHTVSVVTDPISSSLSVQLDSEQSESFNFTPPSCNNSGPHILNLGGSIDAQSNFVGCIQEVSVNSATLDTTKVEFTGDAEFGCTRDTAQFPGAGSFLELPEFISRQSQIIALDINTLASDGIIYFSRQIPADATGDDPNDFLAIYVDSGRAAVTFNLGEEDITVTVLSQMTVNDGQWHSLEVTQNGTVVVLVVDGVDVQDMSMGVLSLLDTTSNVFIGAVPSDEQISSFTSFSDFIGCVRDLLQNGQAVNLQAHLTAQNVRFGTCN